MNPNASGSKNENIPYTATLKEQIEYLKEQNRIIHTLRNNK